MKFCYLDESGTGNEPYAVMAGVIVDAQRMQVTKKQWAELLNSLSQILNRPIVEFHTSAFYPGNTPWRDLSGNDRARIVTAIFEWIVERKHNIVYAAVDKKKFAVELGKGSHAAEIDSLWQFLALHICLAIQKCFQTMARNKGNTLLIFDKQLTQADAFTRIIRDPFDWTDTYYSRNLKRDRLDQIIDVPYFADSQHVGLIQVADFVSFFLRKHIEFQEGSASENYAGERKLIERWIKTALKQSIPKSAIYPSKGRCSCANLFYNCAPSCLL